MRINARQAPHFSAPHFKGPSICISTGCENPTCYRTVGGVRIATGLCDEHYANFSMFNQRRKTERSKNN